MKKISAVIAGALIWIVALPLSGILAMLILPSPGTKIGFFIFGYAASFFATFIANLAMHSIDKEPSKNFRFMTIGLVALLWLGGGLLISLESPDIAFKTSSTVGSLLCILILRNMSDVK